jgi:CDP-diacylglycerol---glycerol-3-phosphate 3-phosphatidyltransferase
MNAATIVTSLRIALSPIFFLLFTVFVKDGKAPIVAIASLWLLFAIIEATDFIDGQVARSTGSVTDLGKVFDPFADSFARLTYFLTYVVCGFMPGWVFLLVLYRDLGVSFIRLVAMSKGITMGAQLSGKIKAFVYAIAGGAGLAVVTIRSLAMDGTSGFAALIPPMNTAAKIAWWLTAVTAAWTMIDYALAYRRMVGKQKKKG